MDWPVIGALTGVALAAGVAAFGSIALVHSGREPVARAKLPAAPTLVPAVERPSFAPGGSAGPTLSSSSSHPAVRVDYAPTAGPYAALHDPRPDDPEDMPAATLEPRRRPPSYAYAPLPPSGAKQKNSALYNPQPETHLKYSPSPDEHKTALKKSPAGGALAEVAGAEQWRVVTTPAANYFNLGGHVDKNGVVDSLASGHLREALKKHKNYAQLPPPAKASIEASNISLVKIAAYRSLLGMDDRMLEREQGVKFIRVASTRGIDDPTDVEADDDAVLGFFMGGPDWAP